LRTLNDTGELRHRRVCGDHRLLADVPPPHVPHEGGTINALRDLVQALDNDGDTLGNLRLACRSQEMIIGFCESHRLGGARVRLPLENRQLYVNTK